MAKGVRKIESKQAKGHFIAGHDSEFAREKKTNRECLMPACHVCSHCGFLNFKEIIEVMLVLRVKRKIEWKTSLRYDFFFFFALGEEILAARKECEGKRELNNDRARTWSCLVWLFSLLFLVFACICKSLKLRLRG
jgi:hypothetical protein